jgi:hypothetical protein
MLKFARVIAQFSGEVNFFTMNTLPYLQGYPESLLSQVTALIEQDRLGEVLQKRYPQGMTLTAIKRCISTPRI